jgi:hypothetical protein
MASNDINISVLDESSNHVALLKIIPYGDGGFGVILPRLVDSQTGRLEKTFVNYQDYGTQIKVNRDEAEQYSAKDIVKFSYHSDGFVQFSSTTNNKIVSGRNPDGTPKGLGLVSWPLNDPISTGPSMTFSFCGLSGFRPVKASNIDDRYTFETKTAIAHPKATFRDGDGNAYGMAVYILLDPVKGEVIDIDGRKYAHMAMVQNSEDGTSFVRLRELVRIIELPGKDFKIGISWFRLPNRFEVSAGYIFLGPTDGKRGLVASYPAVDHGPKLLMKDLEYTKT